MKKVLIGVLLVVMMALTACGGGATEVPATDASVTYEPGPAPTATETSGGMESADPTAEPTVAPAAFEWPAPIAEEEDFSRTPVTAEEQAAADALAGQVYPLVDVVAEAQAFGRIDAPVELVSSVAAPERRVGETDTFWIANTDMDLWGEVEMKLVGISEYAYFWVDVTREPTSEQIERAKAGFDALYPRVREVFGAENVPGIDGDPYIYVLHPSALRVCNVDESTAHQCGLGGYFWGVNQMPTEIIAQSNTHEGIIMNYDAFILGSTSYINVLGHEFRHLVEYWHDEQGETWEIEGSAVMAEELAGIGQGNIQFANLFMAQPDLQLNSWAEGNASIVHYGQGYVFQRYLYSRFGEDFYSIYVQDPRGGFNGLTAVLQEQGFAVTAEQVWQDWLVTLVLHSDPNAPELYRFDSDFPVDPVETATLAGFPRTLAEEVSNYAVDIYRIRGEQDITVNFTGTTKVTTLNKLPPSGQYFWYSGRVNGAFPKLTRAVDLTGVESATLTYSTYYKFSNAFGFGYVLVSTDGGATWEALMSENMAGDALNDDPYGLAWTARFYTSVAPGGRWFEDSVDLTPYVGQTVLIRFASDGNDQSIGWALDNIAIPEIGWYDSVEEGDAGWESEGWTRLTAYIPQTFYLQVITYENGVPVVTAIEIAADNTASFDISGLVAGNDVAYLLVSAIAPQTEDRALYEVAVEVK